MLKGLRSSSYVNKDDYWQQHELDRLTDLPQSPKNSDFDTSYPDSSNRAGAEAGAGRVSEGGDQVGEHRVLQQSNHL